MFKICNTKVSGEDDLTNTKVKDDIVDIIGEGNGWKPTVDIALGYIYLNLKKRNFRRREFEHSHE
jgi:hypothetical protein